jgi:hypothetical protein
VIFSIPTRVQDILFPLGETIEPYLAYIEWFTKFKSKPDPNHRMYMVSRLISDGQRIASIVPISHIYSSIHLFPKFGPIAPRHWTSSNVLDLCPKFFVNSTLNRYIFALGF